MGRVFSLVFCLSLWRKSIEDGTLIYQKMFCPMRRGNMLKVLIADDHKADQLGRNGVKNSGNCF